MTDFNLGDSKAFGDGKNIADGNKGANFWGHDIFKFDGSIGDKQKLLKIVSNYIRILTNRSILVKYSVQGRDESYTDGKAITISSVIIPESLDSTIGLGLHEASHIVKTDFSVLTNLVNKIGVDKKYHKHIGTIKNLFNWVEDRRIDFWAYHNSPGFKKYYEELYRRYFYAEKVAEAVEKKSKVKRKESIDNYLFYIINSMHPSVKMNELNGLSEIKKIINIEDPERWERTEDTLDIAYAIFDVMLKYIIKEEEEELAQPEPGIGDPLDASGMPGADADGGTESDGEDEDQGDEELNDSDFDDLVQEILEGQRKFLEGKPEDEEGNSIKIGITELENNYYNVSFQPNTSIESVSDDKNKKFNVLTITKIDYKGIISNLYPIFNDQIIKENEPFIKRGFALGLMLGKKLKIRNDARVTRTIKLKTGKIDKRNLHSAGYGSENIFYKKSESKYNDIAIHISMDMSSSMGGNKWHNSLVAIIAICKAASTVQGIRTQLSLRFSTYNFLSSAKTEETPVVINFYDSKFDHINKLKYLSHAWPNGFTPEGVCFEALSTNVMASLLNENTLFINFSDGEPQMMTMSTKVGIAITKKIIDRFRASGMKILSYFISENGEINANFKEMYGVDSVFIDVQSLVSLAKTINDKILKVGKN